MPVCLPGYDFLEGGDSQEGRQGSLLFLLGLFFLFLLMLWNTFPSGH